MSFESSPGGARSVSPEIARASEFDASHGQDLAALLRVDAPAGPGDFVEFWRAAHAAARLVPAAATRGEEEPGDQHHRVFGVTFSSTDGVRLGGWLMIPREGRIQCGVVFGHGYKGRSAPALGASVRGAATLFFCSRGFDRSASAQVPGYADGHVLHGIGQRETYAHLGAAADVWSSAAALLELIPEAAARLFYAGAEFGGGIGALALPWDDRFAGAHLDLPSFGNYPLQVTLRSTGSGEALRRHLARHPEALEVLAYFDAATAARHLAIPTHVAPALFDPVVPPAGQFAVHNALPGPRQLYVRQAGHLNHPGQLAEDRAVARHWQDWLVRAGA
jgi:cephalosporin-C deacetylase